MVERIGEMGGVSTTYHCCLDIAGFLATHSRKKDYTRMLKDPKTGKTLSPDEAKRHLLDELASGKKMLPMSADCDNFSFQTGCGGHNNGGGEIH